MSAVEGDLLSLRFSASSPGVAFGDPPLAPKAMGLCLFRTVQSRCLRLARQAPSLSWESRALEEGSEGARLKSADKPFGISNSKSQITNLRFEIWHLRFRA